MFVGVTVLSLALQVAIVSLPAGAPVATGEYPRLTVTRAEIESVRRRAADEPVVRFAIQRLVSAGRRAFDPPVGELPPFDDAANDTFICRAADLGYAAILADRDDWARRAADIVLAYADMCAKRPVQTEDRVRRYSLQEAIWVCRAAVAADLVFAADVLSDAERQHVVNDLLRPAAVTVMTDLRSRPGKKDGHHQCYNFQAWHCAAVGLIGFLIEDRDLIDWAIDGEYGFKHMIAHDVRDDGIFWERSPGYHLFVIQASSQLCEAALRSGIDLWNLEVPDDRTENEWGSGNWTLDGNNGLKSFRMMFEAPFDFLLPDLRAPRISDSGEVSLTSFVRYLELAYTRTGSPQMVAMLRLLAPDVPSPPGWATFAPEGTPKFSSRQEDDRCVLVIRNGSAVDRGAWYSPRAPLPSTEGLAVRLRYRTIGCTGETPVRVRLVGYCDGKSTPDRCVYLDLPPSEKWDTVKRIVSMPAGTEDLNVEPFLWKAAGCLEITDVDVRTSDDQPVLSAAMFAESGLRCSGGVLPWNYGVLPWNYAADVPEVLPLPEDTRFGTTGLRRAGCSLFPATGLAVLREKWLDPQTLAAALSYGPYGGGHGHPAMLELVVHNGGTTVLPALGTASYKSPLHDTWTNTTLAHNTVVVDRVSQWPRSRWGHDTAARRVCGELLAFHADDRLKLVRARCTNAYDHAELDRTVLLIDGVVLDIFRVVATDDAEHRFDYVLHGQTPLTTDGLSLTPRETLGDSDGYQHLSQVLAARTTEPVRVRFGERLQLVTAPAETKVITAMGLGVSGTHPMPVLLLSRTAQSTVYAVALHPIEDERPVRLSADADRITLDVGTRRWLLELPGNGGASVQCSDVTWKIGVPGTPTRRTGSNPRSWESIRTGDTIRVELTGRPSLPKSSVGERPK